VSLPPAIALGASTGGASAGDPSKARQAYGPPGKARIRDGKAIPPRNAPRRVVRAIQAANRIIRKPYKYGGGHGRWEDSGYDCSGSVSYALHGAGLLREARPSGGFRGWGRAGRGRWITVYAHGGHMYAVIAGLRLDTGHKDPNGRRYGMKSGSGPRWNRTMRSSSGYAVRHPKGY
jgi:hypothetical protein